MRFDHHVLAFNPPQLTKTLPESIDAPHIGGSRKRRDEAHAHDLLCGLGGLRG
jgi:hypothetical protein